jgi:thiol:disulfide interchange protein DsbD
VTRFPILRSPVFQLLLGLLLALATALPAEAGLKLFPGPGNERHFLPADQAFTLSTEASAEGLQLHFRVTPGYYLYRGRFHFEPQVASLHLTPIFARDGESKDDPNLGHVEVYHQDIDITLKATGSGDIRVTWQGCADAGICYPPQSRLISLPAAGQPSAADTGPAASTFSPAAAPGITADNDGSAQNAPSFFHTRNKAAILLILFGLGLGLAFTPCVLPMLPILSGIIARQHTRSARRGFLLSLSYVLGMATTYALTGLLFARFGAAANLPVWFQHPAVLIVFSLIFIALALAMFGLYELQLPAGLRNHFDGLSRKAEGGQYIGSYVMGFFSALVVSPCVSAPLTGVLLYISTTGNAAFGALALFVMALGMGVPLLILGSTEGRFLPKAGDWMIRIKIFFGIMLLGVAVLLLGRILPGPITLLLWAALATVSAVWLGALEPVQPGSGHLWKGLGVLTLIYAAVLVVGAATGNEDPLMPLSRFANVSLTTSAQQPATSFRPVKTSADLDAVVREAAASNKTVMLDFYADWCVSCKLMARNVFTDARVAAVMGKLVLVQADVTRADAEDRALLDRFGLAGPPAILFFRNGQELRASRVEGEMGADEFLARLNTIPGGQ